MGAHLSSGSHHQPLHPSTPCDRWVRTGASPVPSALLRIDYRLVSRRVPQPRQLADSRQHTTGSGREAGGPERVDLRAASAERRQLPRAGARPGARIMSRRSVRGCLALALAIALAGCQAGGAIGPDTAIGGLGGAAAGGLLGAAAGGGGAGIAAGTILGGLLGAGIGQALDQRSQRLQAESVHRTLETAPSGTVTTWANP